MLENIYCIDINVKPFSCVSIYSSFTIFSELSSICFGTLSPLANFHVPKPGDVFDEVKYSEIYGAAAEKIVRQYKDDAYGGTADYPSSTKRSRYSDSVDVRGRYPPSCPPSRYDSGGGGYM